MTPDQSKHPDLLTPTRERLLAQGAPWVIENVPNAPMRADLLLCGCMFGLGRLERERWFETSWHAFDLRHTCIHTEPVISVVGTGGAKCVDRGSYGIEVKRQLMGIDWMSAEEIRLAIPPAYTEYVGAQLMEAMGWLKV